MSSFFMKINAIIAFPWDCSMSILVCNRMWLKWHELVSAIETVRSNAYYILASLLYFQYSVPYVSNLQYPPTISNEKIKTLMKSQWSKNTQSNSRCTVKCGNHRFQNGNSELPNSENMDCASLDYWLRRIPPGGLRFMWYYRGNTFALSGL